MDQEILESLKKHLKVKVSVVENSVNIELIWEVVDDDGEVHDIPIDETTFNVGTTSI